MKSFTTLLLIFTALHSSSAQKSSQVSPWWDLVFEQSQNGVNYDEDGFPAVYTVTVALEDLRKEEFAEFLSNLDVLASDYINDDSVKMSVLIHIEEEYDTVSNTIPPTATLQRNQDETQNLRKFEVQTSTTESHNSDTISGFPCYRNLQGIFKFMDDLVEKASSVESLTVELTDIGDSYLKTVNPQDGYDIKALKITGNGVENRGMSTTKGVFFVNCGIHAREYAPPELGARWAESLVDGYGIDTEITSILDHTLIYIILEGNPDGRMIAETQPSLYWRKNRRPGCSDLFGVDLNRNFDFNFGLVPGSSGDPCSQAYRGTQAESEPEVQALASYAREVFPADQRRDDPEGQVDDPYREDANGVFIDIHAYGKIMIYSYTYEERLSPNDDGLQALARKWKSFNNYNLAGPQQPNFIYPSSGTTKDWFYGGLGAASYTLELGTSFYQDCATFLQEIVPDNIPSLNYAAKTSVAPFSLSKGPDITALDIPAQVNYNPVAALNVTITVSDNELSAGPGNFGTSTQSISSINITIDMHPYDRDIHGNGPHVVQLAVDANSGTVSDTFTFPLSLIQTFFQHPKIGAHTLYALGTDSDGYSGLVMATSFEITCVDKVSFMHDGVEMSCDAIDDGKHCARSLQIQKSCPRKCNLC